jgi:hypothetical protein
MLVCKYKIYKSKKGYMDSALKQHHFFIVFVYFEKKLLKMGQNLFKAKLNWSLYQRRRFQL